MQNQLFKKNYLLGIDIKTLLVDDNLPEVGKSYSGVLTLTNEFNATFVEKVSHKTDRRNSHAFRGSHITMTLRPEDDYIRLNFKELHFSRDFNIDAYAIEVMQEVREALSEAKGLVEKAE
ncbi:MAG: hypothetical protein KBT20_04280 [Bacteroidales bacterium]|nr:hypothetical protein [Candidatus Liminaster caballi]